MTTNGVVKIEKIVYPGRSLARVDGKVVFTDEGLPGEEVELEIIPVSYTHLTLPTN